MGRIAGDNGRVYIGIANSAATAEPLPFVAKYNANWKTDKYDVTAMGDGQKTYVSGLRDASGSFSGFFDNTTSQTYAAALDGQPRKFYLYPDTNSVTQYFFGTIIADFSIDGGVGGPVSMSADWSAYSTIARLP
jgi:hypothetical protein